MLRLDLIRRSLGQHRPRITPPRHGVRRAAVALVLAGDPSDLKLCFIRRAESAGDPWSGHMALPGGRADPEDVDAQATALRETREEVGLELSRAQEIGALSELPVRHGGAGADLVLSAFVFYLGPEPTPLSPNEEVAEAYWIPLAHLWDPRHGTHLELNRNGRVRVYPAIRFRGQVIWGLTFRVLTLFSDVLDHPLPHLEEIAPSLPG